MGFELSRSDFSALPYKKQNLVIYDNIVSIKTNISFITKTNRAQKQKFYLGYIWLSIISVYIGLKKYIPIF